MASAVVPSRRIASLDIIRGAVMVLMAIDHVRVYAGVPAGGPTAGVFFTRWVTHFCAPAFVFLAGTGAYFHGLKLTDSGRLSRFLVTRGLLLVALELTVVRLSWTFNVDYAHFTLAGVIWMLGWCMVLLAALVRLSTKTIGIAGLALILCQPLFHFVPRLLPASIRPGFGAFWEFIYPAGFDAAGNIQVLYVIVPWIGVMAAGYAFGAIMTREPADRRRLCLRIGLAATALFVIITTGMTILGPGGENGPPALFRALSPSKYPASPLFLMMTLGPAIALIPLLEAAKGRIAGVFTTFGRVPLFYYLLHIPLIHVAALIVTRLREGMVHPGWYATAPYAQVPRAHQWTLGWLYMVWLIVVAVLYAACRWYAGVKSRRSQGWLSYL